MPVSRDESTDPSESAPNGHLPPSEKLDIPQLVADHHAVLYRYAFRLTGRVHDAEDLVQQTFAIAQQKLHTIRDPSRTRSWLFTTLRRRYLRTLRKQTPTPATSMELDVELVAGETPTGDDEPDLERLQLALDGLPDAYRVVVLMFYFEQCSYQEIADQLEMPIGTVMSRLSRGKAHLRRVLAGHAMDRTGADCISDAQVELGGN